MIRFLCCCGAIILLTLVVATGALADSPGSIQLSTYPGALSPPSLALQVTPEPTPTLDPLTRLAEPPLSDPPTQVELGHHAYWFSCMVCHGDRGQGLTDEWRDVNPMLDRNCWQSRCHAPNHPPEGFEIPRQAPPVIGEGTLRSYGTAADLFETMRDTMPWPFPGWLEDDGYWNLTAFLAEANGVILPAEPLGPDNGADVLWRPQLAQLQRPSVKTERIVTVAVLALLLGTVVLQRWSRPR